jgi:predicted site-specific integrase-resolvase
MKSQFETHRKHSISQEFGCSTRGVTICGRVASEKQKYAELEEELQKTKAENGEYRQIFATLFQVLNYSLRQNLVVETFRQRISEVPLVQSVYCLRKKNSCSFFVLMKEENWEIENRVFDIYGNLLDIFPELDIRVKVLRAWGRKEEEMTSLIGGSKILG